MADENAKTEEANENIRVLAEYNLAVHGMLVDVKIYEDKDFVPIYSMTFPGIGSATKLLLLSLRKELVAMVPLDPTKIENKEYIEVLNKRYVDASNVLIDKYLPGQNETTKTLLIAYIVNMMLGLGELEVPLADDGLEEITVNGANFMIWVFHRKFGWCKTNIKPASEAAIYEDSEQIGRRVGREINNLAPLMDAELPDGSRVNSTLFPVSQSGNTITIRKFSKNPWTMPAMIKNRTVSAEIASLIWLCIENEISLIVAGGTASGKTSFLNSFSIFFPPNRRIISVEETRELTLPNFLQWVPMITRQPNPEGKGEITLYDLMINALRQRPDIMLVGEVRTKKDAETLFEAVHTGHAVYGTLHADNAQDAIIRMTNPPIDTPKIMLNALGGIVVCFRHRTRGIRRLLEFGEIMRTGDANVIYRWDMREDSFLSVSTLTRLEETLNIYAGMTKKDISDSLQEKSLVLNYMVNNNIIDVDDAGLVVANYYKDRKRVVENARNNVKFSHDTF